MQKIRLYNANYYTFAMLQKYRIMSGQNLFIK